jgi:ABC-type nickel/cobalt efflux system permease component RcnA
MALFNPATGYRNAAAAAALALVWAWSGNAAQACFSCSGNAGDFTALSIITWQMQALHTTLTSQMAAAHQGLAQGQINGALAGILGFGFLYGGLHALGPGHGKLALGAHAAASGEGWRGYAVASLIASFGHVISAALAVAAVLFIFNGVLSDVDTMRRMITAVAGGGLALVGALLLITGGHLHFGRHTHGVVLHAGHDHSHDHAHSHGHAHAAPSASLMTIALASAMVPCSSSMLVLMYGAANGFILLGLVVVLFIALGQAIIQTGAAFAGLGLRGLFVESFGAGVLRIVSMAAGAAILIVGIAALHSAIS